MILEDFSSLNHSVILFYERVPLGLSLGTDSLLTCLFSGAVVSTGVKGADHQGVPSLPCRAGSDGLSPGTLSLWARSRTQPGSELRSLHRDCVLFVPCQQGAPAPAAHGTGDGRNWPNHASTQATAIAARKKVSKICSS